MIHVLAIIFQVIALLGCISACIYYAICVWAAFRFRAQQASATSSNHFLPPVSILKPLKGTDPEMYESFRSHCLQDYPEYEIIFGVSDPADSAVEYVQQLIAESPEQAIRLVVCPNLLGANVKVSNLEQMVQEARYPYLIVNDSDIRVEDDYLHRVMAPLFDARVGMVTCLYRGIAAASIGSKLESLGISSDFCPSVLVARELERGLRFALGSTMAFRRADLEKIGGFKSMVDYLADDYELGRRISGLGLSVIISDVVVETHLPDYSLRGFWDHQLRWFRGVRDARRRGYIGLVSTFGVMWAALLLLAAGGAAWSWAVFSGMLLVRIATALALCRMVLQDEDCVEQLWLVPLRDLIAAGVWIASFAGHDVTWRGERFRLKDGRLIRIKG